MFADTGKHGTGRTAGTPHRSDLSAYLQHLMSRTNMSCLTPRSALEGDCGFLAANLYARSIFGGCPTRIATGRGSGSAADARCVCACTCGLCLDGRQARTRLPTFA